MTTKGKTQLRLGVTPDDRPITAPRMDNLAGDQLRVEVPGEGTRKLDPHIEGEPLWLGGLCIACGGSGHFGPRKRSDGVWANYQCDKCDGCGDRQTWLVKHGKAVA